MSAKEIIVPDIGDFKDVPVIEVLVKVGDTVAAEQSLITVESDKSTMEIPSPTAGVIRELRVKLGDTVNTGVVIGLIEEAVVAGSAPSLTPSPSPEGRGEASAPPPPPTPPPAPAPPVPIAAPLPSPSGRVAGGEGNAAPQAGASLPHASPSVRKFARELGADLTRISGSGPKGRITQEDVQGFVKAALSGAGKAGGSATGASGAISGGGTLNLLPWPNIDFSKFGTFETVPLSRIKKISGANLARNWVMIPHVTQHDEADITDLEEFRKATNEANAKSGVKLTMLAFIIKASVAALKKFPDFNSSLDQTGENLLRKNYWNIGFAADTPNGLVVPVIKGADKKGILAIAAEMGELSAQARDGKLKPADMQGASFTISSLGGIGGTGFTPIVNAPEVAILGVSKSQIKPVWDGAAFQPRLMVPLSLSYDHRVIDGASGARFAAYLGQVLSDMRRVLL